MIWLIELLLLHYNFGGHSEYVTGLYKVGESPMMRMKVKNEKPFRH